MSFNKHQNSKFLNDPFNNLSYILYEKTKQGFINGWDFPRKVKSLLTRNHHLTSIKLYSKTNNSTKWADLDPVDHRYLVMSPYNGGIELYDTDNAWMTNKFNHIGSISINHPNMHTEQVTCIQWYPYDAGLILTSCRSERKLKIWDPNTFALADEFHLPFTITHHNMSSVASGHSLIATALNSGQIILCDLRSGSSSHTLQSKNVHKPICFVQWSKHDQNILASGGHDNLIRLWDVRFAKSRLKTLNESFHDKGAICSMSFSYDGLWLITLSSHPNRRISLWNTKTFQRSKVKFKVTEEHVRQIPHRIDLTRSLYPDFLYVPFLKSVYVCNLFNGSVVNELKCHDRGVNGVIYNPANGDLYAYGGKKNLLVFSPKSLIPKKIADDELEKHTKRVKISVGEYKDKLPNANLRNGENCTNFDHTDQWSSDSEGND